MADIIVNLATGYEKQGYADPSSVEISEGDRIIFHSIDSLFKVIFFNPATIKDNLNNTDSYEVPLGKNIPTKEFVGVLPEAAEYKVEILSVDKDKGSSKMTVKALISRNK